MCRAFCKKNEIRDHAIHVRRKNKACLYAAENALPYSGHGKQIPLFKTLGTNGNGHTFRAPAFVENKILPSLGAVDRGIFSFFR